MLCTTLCGSVAAALGIASAAGTPAWLLERRCTTHDTPQSHDLTATATRKRPAPPRHASRALVGQTRGCPRRRPGMPQLATTAWQSTNSGDVKARRWQTYPDATHAVNKSRNRQQASARVFLSDCGSGRRRLSADGGPRRLPASGRQRKVTLHQLEYSFQTAGAAGGAYQPTAARDVFQPPGFNADVLSTQAARLSC